MVSLSLNDGARINAAQPTLRRGVLKFRVYVDEDEAGPRGGELREYLCIVE
jgi:hypothetical protein